MRLSDIMSHVELTLYPLVALVIFIGVFVLVVGRAMRTNRTRHEQWARIPLSDEPVEPRTANPSKETRP
ncbi:MAG: cbb3-type cytochrome c oxidase subunit 3 [Phycisphaerales bacterium]